MQAQHRKPLKRKHNILKFCLSSHISIIRNTEKCSYLQIDFSFKNTTRKKGNCLIKKNKNTCSIPSVPMNSKKLWPLWQPPPDWRSMLQPLSRPRKHWRERVREGTHSVVPACFVLLWFSFVTEMKFLDINLLFCSMLFTVSSTGWFYRKP